MASGRYSLKMGASISILLPVKSGSICLTLSHGDLIFIKFRHYLFFGDPRIVFEYEMNDKREKIECIIQDKEGYVKTFQVAGLPFVIIGCADKTLISIPSPLIEEEVEK